MEPHNENNSLKNLIFNVKHFLSETIFFVYVNVKFDNALPGEKNTNSFICYVLNIYKVFINCLET